MHDEFEMSMMRELNFFLGLQIKQMEDGIFFNQSKYIKEILKKFGLEYSKPTKTPMSMEIKLTKDDEAGSVDSTKYRGEIMPSSNQKDYHCTKVYQPRIHRSKTMDEDLKESYHLVSFLTLDEPIFPRFVTEFYHSLKVKRDEEERPYIEFKLGNTEMEPDIENMTISEYLENYFVSTNESNDADIENMTIAEYNLHDDDSEEDQEEDGVDEDTFDMWDIMVEDIEWIRKIFNVPKEIDEIAQPLIPEPIHTTPPNDDYVAPATKSILDELLEEFGDEILNVTMVDDKADFNPTKDLEELERLLTKEPQSNFMEIQGYYSEETEFEVSLPYNCVVKLLPIATITT
ncbi:retrovirus-related pol polyprotein from transposon TNT 1-94 [Tanacetum coccineum]